MVPQLYQFVNEQSFLMLDHLGWDKEDLEVFAHPFHEWGENDDFKKFCIFVNGSVEDAIGGMSLLNDEAERCNAVQDNNFFLSHESLYAA